MVSYLNFKKNISISPQALDQRFGEETISDILKIEDEIVKRIKYDLKGRYTPGMVKRVEIPKGDGEFRPLGIPDI
ncbi:MAG: hypothetical protein ACRC6A_05315, partial [Fusobacteriaceae bacterium]